MGRDLPDFLSDDEAAALLEVFNTRYDSGVKNRAMVAVMLHAGLRVGEVASLRTPDVDLDESSLRVVDGKGARDRQLWLTDTVCDALAEWMGRRPESPEGWMFPTSNGTRTSERSIRRTVKRYAQKAGIDWYEEVSPHTLRHTFATKLLRQTGNLEYVRKALGHADISTTQIYTHLVDEELEEAMRGVSFGG